MKKTTKARELAKRMVGGKLSEMATYSDLFEKTSDAIFLLDLDDNSVLEGNPAVARLLGNAAPTEESFVNWATEAFRPELEANLSKLRAGDSALPTFDLGFVNQQGETLTLEVRASRLKLADYCEVIQLIAKDVTVERNATRDLQAANQRLAALSTTDEMTKLFNFRYLKSAMQQEHERAARYKKPYSVVLCDIDHFKNFNDKNGHLEGDEALKRAAELLRTRSRNTDIVARYGGEEFVVLCPEVDATQATVLAEALRAAIESTPFPHGERQPLGKVTISLGVASFPAHGDTPDEVLRRADEALYEAKKGGRNRVGTAAATSVTAPASRKKSA